MLRFLPLGWRFPDLCKSALLWLGGRTGYKEDIHFRYICALDQREEEL